MVQVTAKRANILPAVLLPRSVSVQLRITASSRQRGCHVIVQDPEGVVWGHTHW